MNQTRFWKPCAAAALGLFLLLALFTPAQAWGRRAADQPAVSAVAEAAFFFTHNYPSDALKL